MLQAPRERWEIGILILKQIGKLESQSPTREWEAWKKLLLGVSTIFSYLGRRDESHWQVLDY